MEPENTLKAKHLDFTTSVATAVALLTRSFPHNSIYIDRLVSRTVSRTLKNSEPCRAQTIPAGYLRVAFLYPLRVGHCSGE